MGALDGCFDRLIGIELAQSETEKYFCTKGFRYKYQKTN
jgi:hypothetical protein